MATMNFQGPGFQMDVPTDWVITSSPQFQAMFIAPSETDGLRANLMITMRPVKPEVTLEEVARLAKETQQKEYTEFEVVEEGELTVSGSKGYQRLYRWFNQEAGTQVLQRQVMLMGGRVLVTLTSTRPVNEQAAPFDKQFASMIDSFRFV